MSKKESLVPQFELDFIKKGYKNVIGIDEVGRGCWAGPVAVGIFIFDNTYLYDDNLLINDSKKLTAKQRETSYAHLVTHNYEVLLGEVSLINQIGIGKTIEKLISDAVEKYASTDTLLLIDGQFSKDFGNNTKKIIKGDSTYYSIAAASILAKVERDQLMDKLAEQYPYFSFESHKGYGTKKHIEALNKFGVTEIHRKNYKPIMKFIK